MGSLNHRPQEKLPQPLNEGLCLFCSNQIKPVNTTPGLDGYEYICNSCNSKVVIQISGSAMSGSNLLASTLLTFHKGKIKEMKEGFYKIGTNNL
jgi:hypothetical protein